MSEMPFRILCITLCLAIVAVCYAAAPAAAQAEIVTATQLLAEIPVAADQPMSGYAREEYRHWIDADHDGCDTRDEVLALESRLRPRPSCKRIRTGLWYSPYNGRFHAVSSGMDIDHVVALAENWRSGGKLWDDATREAYANDMYAPSLIAVTASVNRSKGDRDPTSWLPPRILYRCTYLTHWTAVKWRWQLTMQQAERSRIAAQLALCPASRERIVRPARPAIALEPVVPDPVVPDPVQPGADDPRYATCAEANAAGYGPYHAGVDPEYAWYRDGDGDGTVCER